jgi:hypothetical protein
LPTARARKLSETDLYRPVRDYLLAQGYTVRAEVNHCDITAVKGDELVVIELKKAFGTALLIQAAQRQRITDSVYVALPKQRPSRTWRGAQHLLRRLELGLILVSREGRKSHVEVVFHPVPFRRQKRARARRAVLREIERRSGDFNQGGSSRRKLVTAYRENAIHIAACLDVHGPLSPRQLRAMGTGPKTLSVLYRNVYGWFDRIDRGLYELRMQGRTELGEYRALAAKYRKLAQAHEQLATRAPGAIEEE